MNYKKLFAPTESERNNISYLKVGVGRTQLRILPDGDLNGTFFKESIAHKTYRPREDKEVFRRILCYNALADDREYLEYLVAQEKINKEDWRTFQDKGCPYCNVMNTLPMSQHTWTTPGLADTSYWMRVLNRADGKVYVYKPTQHAFNQIYAALMTIMGLEGQEPENEEQLRIAIKAIQDTKPPYANYPFDLEEGNDLFLQGKRKNQGTMIDRAVFEQKRTAVGTIQPDLPDIKKLIASNCWHYPEMVENAEHIRKNYLQKDMDEVPF